MKDFGHQLPVDRIRDGERIELSADEQERSAVAQRFGLQSLDRLDAHAVLCRKGQRVRASGRIRASLEQACIATGDPVAEHVDEPFEVEFVPELPPDSADEEIELSGEECDTVFYDGAAIDLGTAVADTLALAVDPYPRSAEADAALREAGVVSEADAGPFAALARLKKGNP